MEKIKDQMMTKMTMRMMMKNRTKVEIQKNNQIKVKNEIYIYELLQI